METGWGSAETMARLELSDVANRQRLMPPPSLTHGSGGVEVDTLYAWTQNEGSVMYPCRTTRPAPLQIRRW
jgi:hypothetical protein